MTPTDTKNPIGKMSQMTPSDTKTQQNLYQNTLADKTAKLNQSTL